MKNDFCYLPSLLDWGLITKLGYGSFRLFECDVAEVGGECQAACGVVGRLAEVIVT